MVSEAGIPKIMDFGISHVISSTTTVETATDAYKGTVRWMSRELLFSDENNEGDNDKDEGSQGEDETQTEDVRLQDEDDIKLVTHTQWSDVWAFGMTVLVSASPEEISLIVYANLTGAAHIESAIS